MPRVDSRLHVNLLVFLDAVAFVFAGLGVLILGVFAIIYCGLRRLRREEGRTRTTAKVTQSKLNTFSGITPGHSFNPAFPIPEPPQTFAIHGIPKRPAPRPMSLSSISKWARHMSGRPVPQPHPIMYRSRSPSIDDDDRKVYRQDLQWNMGKALEDQKQRTPKPTPLSPHLRHLKRPDTGQTQSSSHVSKDRKRVGEEEGSKFALDDEPRPPLPTPPMVKEPGSTTTLERTTKRNGYLGPNASSFLTL